MSLMVSISGVRGIVGKTLTPGVIVRYAAAFAEYCRQNTIKKPVVVLGRDGRITGRMAANIVSSTLLAAGVDVRAIGVATTPTIQIAVEKSGAAGGISVTASHNPMEWNGLKFLGPSGMFLDAEENRKLWTIAETEQVSFAPWSEIGSHTADDTWDEKHIELALNAPLVNAGLIREKKFKVVVDCVNASGGKIVPDLLARLGCSVVGLNCDMSGIFAHTPEPVPENLGELCAAVLSAKADLGMAIDPDGDRLVMITEKGEPFGEENTITAAVRFVLSHTAAVRKNDTHTGPVVVNLSTTRAVDDIAAGFGTEVIRTPVGEINVAKKMLSTRAVVGGEGSGGVIYPPVHYGRDAVAGIPLILQLLAEHGGSMSDLKSDLPGYFIVKSKVGIGGLSHDDVLQRIAESEQPGTRINTEDGLRLDFSDSWVHLRKSNTEPIFRIIAEAKTTGDAEKIVTRYKKRITEEAARSH